MAKTYKQIESERRLKLEERRKFLMELPEVYQRDFDGAFKRYLAREFPEVDVDDCDSRFDPYLKERFTMEWPEEAIELSRKYNLVPVWDPDDDEHPDPVMESPARYIRCQDDRIWLNQIQKNSIVNLPPNKRRGRFLIIEIDLSKPRNDIKASVIAIVDKKKKQVKVSGDDYELVSHPEPKDRESSYTYKKMEVWEMTEKERQLHDEGENKILWRLAKYKTSETTDSTDETNWNREERKIYDALYNAYKRDKKIYYGN